MIIRHRKIEIISRKEFEMIDLTAMVEQFLAETAVSNGMVFIMTAHTTSSIVVTEGVECLERDIPLHLERLAPKVPEPGTFGYYHNRMLDFDGRLGFNAGDHLKSVLGGVHAMFAIADGELLKGSRQRVYFVEYDGPLARTVFLQVMGEPAEARA
ncbi:MAG TPA: secondary thiamine-phosphate synthase enzyme YjbQ [Bryobacteraceae bacterium]|nr:secondary thiamine-phosphate synthase enzyme YjbQ [Bryobacteraceae bacterium]